MAFFGLFRRSRPRCAPSPCRKQARLVVERLESRLVPSGSTVSSYVSTTAALPQQSLPVSSATGTTSPSGTDSSSLSSSAQDGTSSNVYGQ